jgi:DNA-binding transcriptional regulator YiaG
MNDKTASSSAHRPHDFLPVPLMEWARLEPIPRVKTLRRALSLTRDEFARKFRIPVKTLLSWEDGSAEPDAPASAYLHVIAADLAAVERAWNRPMHPDCPERS